MTQLSTFNLLGAPPAASSQLFSPVENIGAPQLENPLSELSGLSNTWLIARHGPAGNNKWKILVGCKGTDKPEFGLTADGRGVFASSCETVFARYVTRETEVVAMGPELHRGWQSLELGVEALRSFGVKDIEILRAEPRLNDRFYGEREGAPEDHWIDFKQQDLIDPTVRLYGGDSVRDMRRRLGEIVLETEATQRGKLIFMVTSCDCIQVLGDMVSTVPRRHYSEIQQFSCAEIRELRVGHEVPFA